MGMYPLEEEELEEQAGDGNGDGSISDKVLE
jgi:hypothetical protein